MNINKLGKFRVSRELIHNPKNHKKILQIMGGMIIVRAECIYAGDCFEYTAISDYFDDVETGWVTPDYEFIITQLGDEITVKAKRLEA